MAKKLTENNNTEQQKTTRSRRNTSKAVSKKGTVIRSDEELSRGEVQEKAVVENIKMLYNTIKELKRMGKMQQVARVNIAQEENFARLAALNPELAEEIIMKYRVNEAGENISRKENTDRALLDDTDNMLALINAAEDEEVNEIVKAEDIDNGKETIDTVKVEEFEHFDISDDEQYDVIDLPSNGECYPNKKGKLAVKFLTASDENFITSPSLYRDGLIIDCLLKRKIVDKNFDIDSLVSGDADAITFFLRTSSYGADFPARFTDPETGEAFDTTVDLSQIKYKDFTLKGDKNGWFDYQLPKRMDGSEGDKIKFRFLTRKDEKKLEKLVELDNKGTKAMRLREIAKELDTMLDDQKGLEEADDVYKLEDAIPVMETWATTLEKSEGISVNRLITNRLEMMVMSVNGNTDKKFIKKYVRNMIAGDSLALRRYIMEHTPGLDFNIRIERPESLGGGFINTFLEWTDTVFLSIA